MRLAVPYFTFGFLFAIFKEIGGNAANMPAGIKDFLMSPLMPWSFFWFLYVLLFIYIIFAVTIEFLGVKKGQPFLLIVSAAAFIIQPYIPLVWIFYLIANFLVFFCIGSYSKEFIKNWYEKMSFAQFLFSAILCAIVFYIFVHFGIVDDLFYTHYYQFLMAAAATYFIFSLSWVVENVSTKLFELFDFFGVKTMEIYLSHSFVLGVMRVILQKIFGYEYLWERVFIMTVITWLIMYAFWKRVPTSNKIYKFMFGIR
jgi:fucose 4-O-acetylase-like acetyltransferase